MSAKHTPGPWTVSVPCMGFSAINGPSGELIFGLAAGSVAEKQLDDVCDANASLIAAAPELLAALEEWLAPWSKFSDDQMASVTAGSDRGDGNMVVRSRAIVRQARGENE